MKMSRRSTIKGYFLFQTTITFSYLQQVEVVVDVTILQTILDETNDDIAFSPTARLHTEQLASAKNSKGKKQRKASDSCGAVPSPIVESLTTATTTAAAAAATAVKMFVNNPEDSVLNAVNSILPTEPLQRSELPRGLKFYILN